MADLPARVAELAERVAARHGVEVLETRLAGGGAARKLSVLLDADGPVEADVVERVSKQLSHELDVEDPIPGRYTLEVSTPGLDRPLRSARDFRRQLGHEVRVTVAAEPGPRDLRGVVRAVDGGELVLDVAGAPVRLRLSEVLAAKVVLPW
ncbi:MAG TPA: ribosome maturation factor RimP [Actinomycetes bacterium]|nr:ribosome maturation factor RimP [Actinomycetes bacterium]